MITLFSMQNSGNSYKARLILKLSNTLFTMVDVDKWRGDMQKDEFKKLNSQGKAPLILFENGQTLVESNAILYYFGQNTNFWSQDILEQAQILRWMFFEQYFHEPNIAVRGSLLKSRSSDETLLKSTLEGGYRALDVMEKHLNEASYFGSEHISIADFALYAYTHTAEKSGYDMNKYPQIQRWLDKVSSIDSFIDLSWQPENCMSFSDYISHN